MNYKFLRNTVNLGKDILSEIVNEGDLAVDCTVGNGHDTINLARLVGRSGQVIGFDIQDEAIGKTGARLEESNYGDRVKLIKAGHENIDEYLEDEVNVFVYNLGYLPGGDKEIITRSSTTVQSIGKALKILKANGYILIISYVGHDGGKDEYEGIKELLASLDQREFNVLESNFINQKNQPPRLFLVEKSKGV